MHFGNCFFDGFDDIDVGLSGVFRVDAPLHTDFRTAAVPGFDHPPLNFFAAQIVGSSP